MHSFRQLGMYNFRQQECTENDNKNVQQLSKKSGKI